MISTKFIPSSTLSCSWHFFNETRSALQLQVLIQEGICVVCFDNSWVSDFTYYLAAGVYFEDNKYSQSNYPSQAVCKGHLVFSWSSLIIWSKQQQTLENHSKPFIDEVPQQRLFLNYKNFRLVGFLEFFLTFSGTFRTIAFL